MLILWVIIVEFEIADLYFAGDSHLQIDTDHSIRQGN